MKIEVTSKGEINPNDIPFLSDEQKLIIGKDDKTISLLDNQELLNLIPDGEHTKVSGTSGYCKIPVFGQRSLLLQWGRVSASPGTTTHDYHIPYVDEPADPLVSKGIASSDEGTVKGGKLSNTQFRIRNTSNENSDVTWISIGV